MDLSKSSELIGRKKGRTVSNHSVPAKNSPAPPSRFQAPRPNHIQKKRKIISPVRDRILGFSDRVIRVRKVRVRLGIGWLGSG